jgi:hypothetical protein
MKITTISLTIASVIGLAVTTKMQASELDMKTHVTFYQSMEILGMVLPAGEYVIKRSELLPFVLP